MGEKGKGTFENQWVGKATESSQSLEGLRGGQCPSIWMSGQAPVQNAVSNNTQSVFDRECMDTYWDRTMAARSNTFWQVENWFQIFGLTFGTRKRTTVLNDRNFKCQRFKQVYFSYFFPWIRWYFCLMTTKLKESHVFDHVYHHKNRR